MQEHEKSHRGGFHLAKYALLLFPFAKMGCSTFYPLTHYTLQMQNLIVYVSSSVCLLPKSLNVPTLANVSKGRPTLFCKHGLASAIALVSWEGRKLKQVEAGQSMISCTAFALICICNPWDELRSSESPGGGSDTTYHSFLYKCKSKAMGAPH